MVTSTKPKVDLNATEMELVHYLCFPYKVICDRIGMDPQNFRMRMVRLFNKMGVENRTSLLIKLLKEGRVKLEDLEYRQFETINHD